MPRENDLRSPRSDTPRIDALLSPGPWRVVCGKCDGTGRSGSLGVCEACAGSGLPDMDRAPPAPRGLQYSARQAHDDVVALVCAIVRAGASHIHSDASVVARARQIQRALARAEAAEIAIEPVPDNDDAAAQASYERYRAAGGGNDLAMPWEKIGESERRAWLEAARGTAVARRDSQGALDIESLAIAAVRASARASGFEDDAWASASDEVKRSWRAAVADVIGRVLRGEARTAHDNDVNRLDDALAQVLAALERRGALPMGTPRVSGMARGSMIAAARVFSEPSHFDGSLAPSSPPVKTITLATGELISVPEMDGRVVARIVRTNVNRPRPTRTEAEARVKPMARVTIEAHEIAPSPCTHDAALARARQGGPSSIVVCGLCGASYSDGRWSP